MGLLLFLRGEGVGGGRENRFPAWGKGLFWGGRKGSIFSSSLPSSLPVVLNFFQGVGVGDRELIKCFGAWACFFFLVVGYLYWGEVGFGAKEWSTYYDSLSAEPGYLRI